MSVSEVDAGGGTDAASWPVTSVSHKAVKGRRRKMEDRSVVVHDLSTVTDGQLPDRFAFYGVFDGHCGSEAASFCVEKMPRLLAEALQAPQMPQSALEQAFGATDASFNKTGGKAGCAAVVALVSSSHIYISWIGDCQAVLCRAGQSVKVVNAHKPERPDEKARIEALGGFVVFWGSYRVNGILSVSRAIGDAEYRPFVGDRPDVTTVRLDGSEEFLLLACDGFWDVVDRSESVKLVMEDRERHPDDLAGMADRLVQECLERRSGDNISVVVVHLKPSGAPVTHSIPTGTPTVTSTDAVVASGRVTPEPVPEDESLSRTEFDSTCEGQVTPDTFNLSLTTSETDHGASGDAAGAQYDIQREVNRVLTGALGQQRPETPSPTAQTLQLVLADIDGLQEATSDCVEDDSDSSDDSFSYQQNRQSPLRQVPVVEAGAEMSSNPFGSLGAEASNLNPAAVEFSPSSPVKEELDPAAVEFVPAAGASGGSPASGVADTVVDQQQSSDAVAGGGELFGQMLGGVSGFLEQLQQPVSHSGDAQKSTGSDTLAETKTGGDLFSQLSGGLAAFAQQVQEQPSGEHADVSGQDSANAPKAGDVMSQLISGASSFIEQLQDQSNDQANAPEESQNTQSSGETGPAKDAGGDLVSQLVSGASSFMEQLQAQNAEEADGTVDGGGPTEGSSQPEQPAGGDLVSQLMGGVSSLVQQMHENQTPSAESTSKPEETSAAEKPADDPAPGILSQFGEGVSTLLHDVQENLNKNADATADGSPTQDASHPSGGGDLMNQLVGGMSSFMEQLQDKTTEGVAAGSGTEESISPAPAPADNQPGGDLMSQLASGFSSIMDQMQQPAADGDAEASQGTAAPGGGLLSQLSGGVSAYLQDHLTPAPDAATSPSAPAVSPAPADTSGDGLLAQLSSGVSSLAQQVQANVDALPDDAPPEAVRAQIDKTTDTIFSALSSAVGGFGSGESPEKTVDASPAAVTDERSDAANHLITADVTVRAGDVSGLVDETGVAGSEDTDTVAAAAALTAVAAAGTAATAAASKDKAKAIGAKTKAAAGKTKPSGVAAKPRAGSTTTATKTSPAASGRNPITQRAPIQARTASKLTGTTGPRGVPLATSRAKKEPAPKPATAVAPAARRTSVKLSPRPAGASARPTAATAAAKPATSRPATTTTKPAAAAAAARPTSARAAPATASARAATANGVKLARDAANARAAATRKPAATAGARSSTVATAAKTTPGVGARATTTSGVGSKAAVGAGPRTGATSTSARTAASVTRASTAKTTGGADQKTSSAAGRTASSTTASGRAVARAATGKPAAKKPATAGGKSPKPKCDERPADVATVAAGANGIANGDHHENGAAEQ